MTANCWPLVSTSAKGISVFYSIRFTHPKSTLSHRCTWRGAVSPVDWVDPSIECTRVQVDRLGSVME